MISTPVYLAFDEPLKFTNDPILKQLEAFALTVCPGTDLAKRVLANRPLVNLKEQALIEFLKMAMSELGSMKPDSIFWRQAEALRKHYKINRKSYDYELTKLRATLIELPMLGQRIHYSVESSWQSNFATRVQAFQLLLGDMYAQLCPVIVEEEMLSSEERIPSAPDTPSSQSELSYSEPSRDFALQLLGDYLAKLKKEKQSWTYTLKFFHQTRKDNKIAYCEAMIAALQQLSNDSLKDVIQSAHANATLNKKELDEGGSWIGTSRLLGIQRLLGIEAAWNKGRSSFFGIKTSSDFHGLKAIGVVGEECKSKVVRYYDDATEEKNEIVNISLLVCGHS